MLLFQGIVGYEWSKTPSSPAVGDMQVCTVKVLRNLMGHCYGDFAVFWSKILKYLTMNPFSNMKL